MNELAENSALSRFKKRPDIIRLYADITKDLDKVEENLKLFSHSDNKLIAEISHYLFQKGGKRIRPALLILCSKMLGYNGEEHILMSTLVETIHTASLIHDDIIDKSELRRGKESIHVRWGPNITVLLGDYLYIKALGTSLQSPHRRITQILADTSTRMVEGELSEYRMSGNQNLAEEDYLGIINKKTASLFSASCQIGGILGQASEKEENSLKEYGTYLGMTFQIIDDLLDFTGDEKTLGKPVLSDLSESRITLPLIYTLNNDGKANRERIAELMKKKTLEKESLEEVLKIVKSNGALDYTSKKAEEFSLKSREVISRFPKSSHRDALALLPEYVLSRKN
jgi:octaprenyl-diphosphate synthase